VSKSQVRGFPDVISPQRPKSVAGLPILSHAPGRTYLFMKFTESGDDESGGKQSLG
jgi:hypothetical protein